MTAAWAGAGCAIVMSAGGLGALIARISYRAGRLEEAIARLSAIAERHDDEIRNIRELHRSRR